jgi:hypothetical protein
MSTSGCGRKTHPLDRCPSRRSKKTRVIKKPRVITARMNDSVEPVLEQQGIVAPTF